MSKHDDVSRYVTLIDGSCARLSLYQPSEEKTKEKEEFLGLSDDAVLVDPIGNAPLKVE